jgi:hypothetical protein
MLLDPLEEQLDLPATAIQLCDRKGWQCEVVGQKDQCLAALGIFEADTSERCRESFLRVKDGEHDRLIADQAGGSIHGMGVAALDLEVGLAAGYEEAARLVHPMESLEIEIAPIHDIERTGLGQQLIEDIDLVHLAIAVECTPKVRQIK